MIPQIDRKKLRIPALIALCLLGLGGAAFYVNKNYDVRLVRVDAEAPGLEGAVGSEGHNLTADYAQSVKPAPIVVRLVCANAGSAMSSLKSPSRSLRQQLRQSDPHAPVPLPNKRCKQTAGL
jgi:hypothetical protein